MVTDGSNMGKHKKVKKRKKEKKAQKVRKKRDQVSVNLQIKIMKTSMKIRGMLLVIEVTALICLISFPVI